MRVPFAASVLVVALAAAACGSGSSGAAGNQPQPVSSSPSAAAAPTAIGGLTANVHGQVDVTGKSSVTVQAANYYFEPSVLKGAAGQKLTLHVVNTGSTQHNITLAAQHVDADLDGHATADVTVSLPASGVLSFWCEYHKSSGMVGGLLVSGSARG